MEPIVRAKSFVEIGRARAENQPHDLFFRFLESGDVDGPIGSYAYAGLDLRARAIARALQARVAPSERVLMLFAPGAEFVTAFFGCLYAGVIAVPAYPPDPRQLTRMLLRIRAIATDAGARIALSTRAVCDMIHALAQQEPWLASLEWIAVDAVPDSAAADWIMPELSSDSVALLQYSSGSTGDPKGVMVSHGNLLQNSEAIYQAFDYGEHAHVVSWLPPYHDMGLIGMILQPFYSGNSLTLMSPFDFLRRPVRWLQAISKWRGVGSGAPDFGYALCTRKVTDAELAELDLSSWRVAFTGAENIKSDTIDRFCERFASAGFHRDRMYPTYGLAEATLFVTGPRPGEPRPLIVSVEADALALGLVRFDASSKHRAIVSCGKVPLDVELRIVDPDTRTLRARDEVGEIWISGGSVTLGYWNQPELSGRVFGARLSGDDGRAYLRTGDLGFVRDGELYVVGRIKDVVVIKGRNIYPTDLEGTIEATHACIRKGCVAAFSLDDDGEQAVGIVAELTAQRAELDVSALLRSIRASISIEHGISLRSIALLEPGSLPKTSSGKLQRFMCARQARERTMSGVIVEERL